MEISPSEISKLFPLCRTDDVLAGFYVKVVVLGLPILTYNMLWTDDSIFLKDDGRVNPVDACMSLAAGAKMKGEDSNPLVLQLLSSFM